MSAVAMHRCRLTAACALLALGVCAVQASATRSRTTPAAPTSPAWRGDGRAVTLAFGGDVHFEGVLAERLRSDPATALAPVSRLIAGSDLSIVNLESALTYGGCPDPQPKTYVFFAPPSALTALRDAHVTLVSQANNHGLDCGQAGLRQSLAIERAARYPAIGVGANAAQAFAPYRTVIDGQRIAIIAATQVIDSDLMASWTATSDHAGVASAFRTSQLLGVVRSVRRSADTVVVYLHWGTQTEQCPNALQVPLAEELEQAGADIIVGTHAHVQLGAGYLGHAFVDYGLGNLAFYDSTPPETDTGILTVTITGRHVDRDAWRPATIQAGEPIADSGASAGAAIARWNGLRACTNLTTRPTG